MIPDIYLDIAGNLDEIARLLAEQRANRFRVQAYRRAAEMLRAFPRSVADIYAERGIEGLDALPSVGESTAQTIRAALVQGHIPLLERLRGESDPLVLLGSVPGIGARLALRIHDKLGIETLEELEAAAHDGRLASLGGFGEKRLAGIRDTLAHRMGRPHPLPAARVPRDEPPVAQILDVDREYREKSDAGTLPRIVPRRFNPTGEAWLAVLHTRRGAWNYTVLFSNSKHAHERGKTRDWVVLYFDNGSHERQCTVITAEWGALRGRRIVRGREAECEGFYRRSQLAVAA